MHFRLITLKAEWGGWWERLGLEVGRLDLERRGFGGRVEREGKVEVAGERERNNEPGRAG